MKHASVVLLVSFRDYSAASKREKPHLVRTCTLYISVFCYPCSHDATCILLKNMFYVILFVRNQDMCYQFVISISMSF